jgi:hypothetical protein
MSEVILIVQGSPERRDEMVAAARRLGELIGNGHAVEFTLPRSPALARVHDGAPPRRKGPAREVEARATAPTSSWRPSRARRPTGLRVWLSEPRCSAPSGPF